MFDRPYTVVFYCLVLLSFCWPFISSRIQKSMDRLDKEQGAVNEEAD